MSRQSDYWIYQQLEPDDIIGTGRYFYEPPKWRPIMSVQEPVIHETEAESNQKQNSYLAKHGIF